MTEPNAEQILKAIKRGESLERADLRHLVLNQCRLAGVDLRRADLEGANLEGSNLRNATLTNANLRDAFLANADLEGAAMQRADLEGANLEGANLKCADLSRASLTGANLEGAKLDGANMSSAQLELANLGGASMAGVDLANSDLREAYLGGATLTSANLRFAQMEGVNLEETDLTGADLTEANLRGGYLARAVFARCVMERAILEKATLSHADLTGADLRGGRIRNAHVDGLKLTGAKLAGLDAAPEQLSEADARWVDFSTRTGEFRVTGDELVAYYTSLKGAAEERVEAVAATGRARRFFGEGDVLRNASLEFGEDSVVEVQSRFEDCSIELSDGAQLTIGEDGALHGCRITGPGEIVVHGSFVHNDGSPSIVGPRCVTVGRSGEIAGTLEQHVDLTRFAIESGCALRLKVLRHG